jgi:hypothetical protein
MTRRRCRVVHCGDTGEKGKLGYFFDFSNIWLRMFSHLVASEIADQNILTTPENTLLYVTHSEASLPPPPSLPP